MRRSAMGTWFEERAEEWPVLGPAVVGAVIGLLVSTLLMRVPSSQINNGWFLDVSRPTIEERIAKLEARWAYVDTVGMVTPRLAVGPIGALLPVDRGCISLQPNLGGTARIETPMYSNSLHFVPPTTGVQLWDDRGTGGTTGFIDGRRGTLGTRVTAVATSALDILPGPNADPTWDKDGTRKPGVEAGR